jgi:tRNA (guanine-N7-)-methyltransferase
MSDTKRRALEDVVPRYAVRPTANADLAALFGRSAPLFVDLGFGMGDTTLALAAARPDVNVLAIDVHVAGHASVALGLEAAGLTNVRLMDCDGHEVLMWMLSPASITELHLWFPDPWAKNHQRQRRLVAPDFVDLVASRLVPGGMLRMATDWQDYANQMLRTVSACSDLESTGTWSPRYKGRPITSYEHKGIALGREIRDITAVRKAAIPVLTR